MKGSPNKSRKKEIPVEAKTTENDDFVFNEIMGALQIIASIGILALLIFEPAWLWLVLIGIIVVSIIVYIYVVVSKALGVAWQWGIKK